MSDGDRRVFGQGPLGKYGASAVAVNDWLFVAGQVATAPDGSIAAGPVGEQVAIIIATISTLCVDAGGKLDDLVELVILTASPADVEGALTAARELLVGAMPALTVATFSGATRDGVRAIAYGTAYFGGRRQLLQPVNAGWMAQKGLPGGCRAGELVFVAGQLALDGSGEVLAVGDHCGQARIAYDGMLNIVAAAGGTVDDIIDFTSFHHDIRGADDTLQRVYGPEVLGQVDSTQLAATSHVGVPGLLSPGALGCYTALADLSEGKRVSVTPDRIWWKGVLPVAGGAKKSSGTFIAVAGQVACGSKGEVLFRGDFEAQARYVLDELREVLEGFGAGLEDVVRVTSFHHDIRSWPIVERVAKEFFGEAPTVAWTPIGVSALWMEGYLHEISALAIAR